MNSLLWGMALAAVVGSSACSADKGPGSGAGDGTGPGGGSAGSDGVGTGAGSDSGSGSGGSLTTETACGVRMDWARLSPLNMFVMFDRSGSMEDDDKWPNATAALTAFFEHPAAADVRAALRFFPHDEPAVGCNDEACDAVACSRPLVEIASLTLESAPADTHEQALVSAIENSAPGGEGQGTPLYAALDGALRWSTSYKSAHPAENTVVVFVTDGKPNGCEEDFDIIAQLAADALAGSGVTTYAIGLAGSSEQQMDQLAAAGGTGMAIFIADSSRAEQELLDALSTIRGENLSCDFAFPSPADPNEPIDPDQVSVTFIYANGDQETIGKVASASACGGANAFHYDDEQRPERIVLCPTACDTARAEDNAGLQILLGCATDTGQPLNCTNTPDDPACMVE